MKLRMFTDPLSLQVNWSPFTFAAVSPIHGMAFYRIRGDGHILKAPWNAPLFSERNGYKLPVATFMGWRIFPLRAEELVSLLVRGDTCPVPR